jgi:hypothetical protein
MRSPLPSTSKVGRACAVAAVMHKPAIAQRTACNRFRIVESPGGFMVCPDRVARPGSVDVHAADRERRGRKPHAIRTTTASTVCIDGE